MPPSNLETHNSPPFDIRLALPSEFSEALGLLIAHAPLQKQRETKRLLERQFSEQPREEQGLYVAEVAGQLRAASWVQPMPGRTAVLWPPVETIHSENPISSQLIKQSLEWSRIHEVEFLQALLDDHPQATADALLKSGFQQLTDLGYMLAEFGPEEAGSASADLDFIPYTDALRTQFLQTLERSYEGSLDCPTLTGVRSMQDVLDGYAGTGVFDPQRWLLARFQGQNVGVLLLTVHDPGAHWELIYMGVVPQYRGRGWGRELVREAQRRVAKANATRMILGVDLDNAPAVEIYESLGWRLWAKRSVFWISLAQDTFSTARSVKEK